MVAPFIMAGFVAIGIISTTIKGENQPRLVPLTSCATHTLVSETRVFTVQLAMAQGAYED